MLAPCGVIIFPIRIWCQKYSPAFVIETYNTTVRSSWHTTLKISTIEHQLSQGKNCKTGRERKDNGKIKKVKVKSFISENCMAPKSLSF